MTHYGVTIAPEGMSPLLAPLSTIRSWSTKRLGNAWNLTDSISGPVCCASTFSYPVIDQGTIY